MQDRITANRAWQILSQDEQGAELMRQCYYDWNVLDSCLRFESSEEWNATRRIIWRSGLPGAPALDLGAGNGISCYSLAKAGWSVTAVEPDDNDLVGHGAVRIMAELTNLPVTIVEAFGEELSFQNGAFELVYARQVLHHAQNLTEMLKEIARVLKPGGRFLACREHVIDGETSLRQFLEAHPLHHYTGNEGAFTLQDYLGAIRGAGLTVERVLGPWDSVINFYPATIADVRRSMTKAAIRRYGRLGRILPRFPWWRVRYLRRESLADRRPGRMYTFLATKPR